MLNKHETHWPHNPKAHLHHLMNWPCWHNNVCQPTGAGSNSCAGQCSTRRCNRAGEGGRKAFQGSGGHISGQGQGRMGNDHLRTPALPQQGLTLQSIFRCSIHTPMRQKVPTVQHFEHGSKWTSSSTIHRLKVNSNHNLLHNRKRQFPTLRD